METINVKKPRYTAGYNYRAVKGMKEEEFSKKFPKDSKQRFKDLQDAIKKYEASKEPKKEVLKSQPVAEKPKIKG